MPGLWSTLSWHGARNVWLHGWGLETAVIMLPVVALGAMLARRYGVLSGLAVAGSAYLAIELSIDPSTLIRFGSWSRVMGMGMFLLTFSVVPLLALRARGTAGRTWALLGPLALMLLALLFVPPLVYTIFTSATGVAQQVGTRALQAAQIFSLMAFALSLYDDLAGRGELYVPEEGRWAAEVDEGV